MALGFLVVLLAGLTQGLTGFGYALVAVPLLIIFLPPKTVVPLVLIHCAFTNTLVLLDAWRWVDLKRIWPLMLAGIAGMPLGTYLLVALPVDTLKVFMGSVIALSALAMLLGWKHEIRNERLACAPVGVASGLLSGSTGMSGPPVVLFLANQGMGKQVFRANLVAYFLVLNLATIPTHVVAGLVTRTVIADAALLLPALFAGTFVGIRLVRRVEEAMFRRVTLAIVILAGLLSVASGLRLL